MRYGLSEFFSGSPFLLKQVFEKVRSPNLTGRCGAHWYVREGIEIAKAQGKYTGRKPIEIDWTRFGQLYGEWKYKSITGVTLCGEWACRQTRFIVVSGNMKRNTALLSLFLLDMQQFFRIFVCNKLFILVRNISIQKKICTARIERHIRIVQRPDDMICAEYLYHVLKIIL